MDINAELTDAAILQTLGERIERHRIEANLTQAELADQAGVGKRTLERIEAGRSTELVTLIRVLRALDLVEGFEQLIPALPPSPIAELELRGKQRQRVSHARRKDADDSSPAKPWTWAES